MKKWLLYALMTVVGALVGYAWWYWYGCTEGCAITSVWWRSSAYGAVMGYLASELLLPRRTEPKGAADVTKVQPGEHRSV